MVNELLRYAPKVMGNGASESCSDKFSKHSDGKVVHFHSELDTTVDTVSAEVSRALTGPVA